MEKLIICLWSQEKSFEFEINNDSEDAFRFYLNLLSIFISVDYDNQKIKWDIVQKKTSNMQENINNFLAPLTQQYPTLNRIINFINRLDDGEYFFILPEMIKDEKEAYKFETYLSLLNSQLEESEIEAIHKESLKHFESMFDELFAQYSLQRPDCEKKYYVGESDKSKRVCRFCHKSIPLVKFENEGHAIPESLGNINLINHEECDDCNDKYAQTLDQDIVEYFDIIRIFYRIKNKKRKIPKADFENGKISIVDDILSIAYTDVAVSESDSGGPPEKIILKPKRKFKPIDIYRSLSRITLSIIGCEILNECQRTIEWINFEWENSEQLRKVGYYFHENIVEHPSIQIYIRKTDEFKLPYIVSELRIKSMSFVYILPYTNRDSISFVNKEEYDYFWKFFKHFSAKQNWHYLNLSSSAKDNHPVILRFIKSGN